MAKFGFQKYYHAPLPAIIAVLIVYVWQGLGHTVMYLMEHRWFPERVLLAAVIIGFVGAVMIYVGRNKSENAATLLGFAGGSLVWLSWIEFSFVWVADELAVPEAMWGAKPTLPEYRVMLSSVGVLFASLLFFFYNKDTRCNAFMWLHWVFRMNVGEKVSAQSRNLCAIVAMETIYVTWFFYIWLLVIYNPALFGTDHWVTFASCGFFAVWALYLIQRLWWFQRMAPALRDSDCDHCLERQRDPREMGSSRRDLGAAAEIRRRDLDCGCGARARYRAGCPESGAAHCRSQRAARLVSYFSFRRWPAPVPAAPSVP